MEDLTDTAKIPEFKFNMKRSMRRAQRLADNMIYKSHVPFLGLLCGDVCPQVVWKIMYLSERLGCTDEGCTLLSIVTDYIVNTPYLVDEAIKAHDFHDPWWMVRVLADLWSVYLPDAKWVLTPESYSKFKTTLCRAIQTLHKYRDLHKCFEEVWPPAPFFNHKTRVDEIRWYGAPIPYHGRISKKKLKTIRAAADKTELSVDPSKRKPAVRRNTSTPFNFTSVSNCPPLSLPAAQHRQSSFVSPACNTTAAGKSILTTTATSQAIAKPDHEFERSSKTSVRWDSSWINCQIYHELQRLHLETYSDVVATNPGMPSSSTSSPDHKTTAQTRFDDLLGSVHSLREQRRRQPDQSLHITRELYFNPQ